MNGVGWRVLCSVIILVIAGCGTAVYPRISADAPPLPGARPPVLQPRPTSDGGEMGMLVRRACRTRSVPAGWVVTAYEASDECPPRAEDETHTVAVLERLPAAGAMFTMCADQPVPRGWTRSSMLATRECAGARVREGTPTSVTIRRR
jgi:hypothetical protein